MRLFANASYDFIGNTRRALVLLGLLIVPGLVLIAARGVEYSVEFTGGTLMRVETREAMDVAVLRSALAAEGIEGAEIQRFGSDRVFVIRALTAKAGTDADDTQATRSGVEAALDASVGAGAYTVLRTEAVGPKVGSELRSQALWLVLISMVTVLLYLAFRFEWRFGVAAVVATLHDIVSAIAFIGLARLEVSLFVVGALLSIVGYSLNDKIVVLDRVREDLRKHRRDDFAGLLNRAINETLPRTVFTGATALGSLFALAALGGEVVRGFALVMLYGVVVGTVSSMFVAAPALLWIERRWPGAAVKGLGSGAKAAPSAPAGGRKARPTV